MAERLSLSLVSAPTLKAMAQVNREIQKANTIAVRAAAKALTAEAKRRAPVYAGPRRDVLKGRLRRSIRAGRVFKTSATAVAVTVGPRGRRVRLYAGKIEATDPYMKPAEVESATTLARIAAAAYIEAMNRGAR